MFKGTILINAALILPCLLLGGCDQIQKLADSVMQPSADRVNLGNPSLVIQPGWLMNDHGKPSLVSGFSQCPPAQGSPTNDSSCVIIYSNSRTVSVSVIDTTSKRRYLEDWKVERNNNSGSAYSVNLKRPDNSFVKAWSEK